MMHLQPADVEPAPLVTSTSNLELLRQYVDEGGNKLLVINRGRSRKSVSFTLSVFVVGREREVLCLDRIVAPLVNARLQRDEQLKHGIQYCVQSRNPAADLVHEVGKLLGTTPSFQVL
jgi:hypothetical protein